MEDDPSKRIAKDDEIITTDLRSTALDHALLVASDFGQHKTITSVFA